ncbi:MAG TPA: hypothetical protein VEC11_11280 [Allosphingosinicella sp.]|nr:hypothetical protein [Allosphingosinicella sp.]
MAWYWWVLIPVAGFVLFYIVMAALAGSPAAKQRRRDELNAIFEPVRRDLAVREEEGAKALALVLELPVATSAGAGDVQSREKVSETVMNMARTRHVSLHVSLAPERVTFVQQIAGQPGKSMVRTVARRDAESWVVRTRMGRDFSAEVRAAQAGEEGEGR